MTTIKHLTLTSANTQYSIVLGTIRNVRIMQAPTDATQPIVRVALEPGKVAAPTLPYWAQTLTSDLVLSFSPPQPITLYAASPDTNINLLLLVRT